jgi:hypothetical protein
MVALPRLFAIVAVAADAVDGKRLDGDEATAAVVALLALQCSC